MKRLWMAIIIATLFSSQSLFAASVDFCDQYTKTSIKQQLSNIAASCKQKGGRWSSLYQGQYAWCRTVRESIANNETNVRNDELNKCGAPLSKKVWENIENTSADYWLYSEMVKAAKKDDLQSVTFMHSLGVSTADYAGDNDGGLLYTAVDHQAEKVSKFLLGIGKSPKAIPNGGGNALAAMVGDPVVNYRMLAMLLENGFDPNYGGEGYSDSYFPILQAAIKNNYRAMQMLLKAGGDANLMRESSPLIYAIKNRNMAIVQMLLNAGADVNKADQSGQTPFDIALKSGSRALINVLKAKGAKRSVR